MEANPTFGLAHDSVEDGLYRRRGTSVYRVDQLIFHYQSSDYSSIRNQCLLLKDWKKRAPSRVFHSFAESCG